MERTSYVPSFFKVLINKDFSTRLPLPAAFVKKFGVILSEKCVLQICSNQCWEVDVVKDNERMYFTKGWNTFVKDNLVEFLDFVVLKFVGNSTFEAKIYGIDGCEKKLYMSRDTNFETERNGSTDDDKAQMHSAEFCEGHKAQMKPIAQNRGKRRPGKVESEIKIKKQESKCWGTQTRRKVINGSDDNGFETTETSAESGEIIYIDSDPPIDKEFGKYKGSSKKQRDAHVKCISKSLEEADRFKSKYPFFRIALKMAYVENGYAYVPTKFYDKQMKKDDENVEVQISGRAWTLGLLHNQQNLYNTARFSAGWKEFVKDNKLKIGDICIFELRRKHSALFQVYIFRC